MGNLKTSSDTPVSFLTQLKVHNFWSWLFSFITIIITLFTYVQPYVRQQAQSEVGFVQTEAQVQQLQTQIKTLNEDVTFYKQRYSEVKQVLDSTNVLGVATGSAIKKIK